MKVELKGYALPTQEQNGDLKALGTIAEVISDDAKVRFTKTGIMVNDADGTNYFFRFSQGVLKAIKDGTVNESNMGHLIGYTSDYVDDDGVAQTRLVAGLPQGFSGEALDAKAVKAASTKSALTPKVVSIENFKLSALFA